MRGKIFLQTLDNIPIPDYHLEVDVDSFQVWKDTIRNLKNGKAPGIDFWRAEEIKALPDNAVCDLKDIFSQKNLAKRHASQNDDCQDCVISQK